MTVITSHLALRLCTTDTVDIAALSHHHFGATPATIALSEELRVAFVASHLPDRVLGYGDLAAMGLTTITAWDKVASSLAGDFSSTFLVRHLHTPHLVRAIHIRAVEASTSEWLAHPALFARLHQCARQKLGTPKTHFHVLDVDTVIATDRPVPEHQLREAATDLGIEIAEDYFFPGLTYFQGFPATHGRFPRNSASALAR